METLITHAITFAVGAALAFLFTRHKYRARKTGGSKGSPGSSHER